MKTRTMKVTAMAVFGAAFAVTTPLQAQSGPPTKVSVVDTRTPVQVTNVDTNCNSAFCVIEVFTVPAGKRLVIQRASFRTAIGPSGQSAQVAVHTEFDDQPQIIGLGVTADTGSGVFNTDLLAVETLIYAQSGTDVLFAALTPDGELMGVINASITGYLEDES